MRFITETLSQEKVMRQKKKPKFQKPFKATHPFEVPGLRIET